MPGAHGVPRPTTITDRLRLKLDREFPWTGFIGEANPQQSILRGIFEARQRLTGERDGMRCLWRAQQHYCRSIRHTLHRYGKAMGAALGGQRLARRGDHLGLVPSQRVEIDQEEPRAWHEGHSLLHA